GVQIDPLLQPAAGETSLVVTGLVNETPVKFQIQAVNAVGTSVFSAYSALVTPTLPGVAPSAPLIGPATSGDTTATVNWTTPADGGQPITGYSIQRFDGSGVVAVGVLLTAPAGATSLVVPGLLNGIAVGF